MELPFNHKNNYINPIETENNKSIDIFIIKERREQLISKRKEFIQNHRKKQRLLSQIEKDNYNIDLNFKNDINNLTINDIEKDPDPISRIILIKLYFQSNLSKIDLNFININLNIIKTIFSDFKKVLFDYTNNNNITYQTKINKFIIYCYLILLFEPELNPLINEFDYEFFSNINTFCFYYLNINNNNLIIENIINLHLYIMLLLNNLIRIHPDVELLKATIDIKNLLFSIYNKYFYFSFSNNKSNDNNNETINNNKINLNECDKKKNFFEFTFLKLIENCVVFLHLGDKDKKELMDIILNFIYYNYSKNDIQLLIYSLETLVNINKIYLLLENNNYNNFLLKVFNNIINNNENNNNIQLIKIKLIFQLYLQQILLCLKCYNNNKINFNLYLDEKIIIYFKNYYYQFYQYLLSNNKKELNNIEQLKIISKITKIFDVYFDLINSINISFITSEQKNNFKIILCTHLISKDKLGISLYDILINIFIYLIESNNKHCEKICNLIITIFNNIYPLKNIDYKNDITYIKGIQIFLIENYSLHIKLFKFLNMEKYSFIVENLLELINRILFFCEQIDIYEKGDLFIKIKKDLNDLNIFDEIENIECNTINCNIKFLSQKIIENYFFCE